MIVEFSVVPIGEGEELAEYIAKVVEIIDTGGLSYQLTAMGTIVEGTWDDVFALIKACHQEMRQYADRVYTHIAIDDRARAEGRIRGKVEDVEEVLGRDLKK